MANLNLYDSENDKVKITKNTEKAVLNLYKQLAKKAQEKAKNLPKDADAHEQLKKMRLEAYVKQLNAEIDALSQSLNSEIQNQAKEMSKAVVEQAVEQAKSWGLDFEGAYSYIPDDIVKTLYEGKLYEKGWTPAQSIWKDSNKIKSDIQKVVAEGLAENKSTYAIAKDLEKYVSPTARKDWDWSKVYPGTKKKIDYNAQRLARTMVQHAYQLSLRETIRYNPFVTGVEWHSVFAPGRTCALCKDRDGTVYKKGQEPLDHPNGLCYLVSVIPNSMDQIADRLAAWSNGASDPAIDNWVEHAFR